MSFGRSICSRLLAFVFVSAFVVTVLEGLPSGLTADAQESADSSSDIIKTLEPVLDKARETGATIVVIDPNAAKAGSEAAEHVAKPGVVESLKRARAEFARIMGTTGGLIPSIGVVLAIASPDGSLSWLLWAIGVALIAMVFAEFARRRLRDWGRKQFLNLYDPNPRNRSAKIGYLLSRALLLLIGVVLFVVVAALIASFVAGDHGPARITAQFIVLAATGLLFADVVLFNVLAPDTPTHRMIDLSDNDASGLYRGGMIVVTISVSVVTLCAWVEVLGLSRDAHKLALIAATFISAMAISVLAVIYREPLYRAMVGPSDAPAQTTFLRLLARNWHILAIVYVIVAWMISSLRLILDLPSALGLVMAPLLILVGALVVYAIGILIIDRLFARSEKEAKIVDVSKRADGSVAAMEALPDEVVDAEIDSVEGVAQKARMRNDFRELIEHGLSILVILGAIAALVGTWSFDFFAENNWVSRVIDIAMVVFIAYLAYRATEIWIDRQIEEEDPEEHSDGESEVGGQGGSRLSTLLPIFRNFLLISIVVIATMIGLSEIGVDIGPLFAGAGVVGLAIGFGAQTLVRDIFSGAFFLMDDAFRKGEYIDIGSAKGAVEKVSIRSFQLRHHNGPLNTIPFGEIKQLTNFSRDWVIMKLPMRVTYDTDVEKVRKLIKKLGQELLEDPDVGPLFLAPLKSQGVTLMEDSAMIIRVKFTTKPGDQFLVRRVVYTRIRELFEREGIKFAHREVTVRIAEDEHGEAGKLTPEQKEAVAGAVLPAIEAQQAQGNAPTDDRG